MRTLAAAPRSLTVAGEQRSYLLTTPPAHDGRTPLPLVLDFHGLAEGAQIHTHMSNFGALANRDGFVVVFPQGTGTIVRWNAPGAPTNNKDLDYVDALLTRLGKDLCIDTSRVYASGLSNGAFMASFVACARANRFAAVAPVAGVTVTASCTPSRPVPVIAFHGTADPILRFNGGLGAIPGITPAPKPGTPPTTLPPARIDDAAPGYPSTVAAWAERNGCDATPTDTKIGRDVVHRVYRCPAGQDVEFYIVLGGGHAWPGSEFSRSIAKAVGRTTFTVDATRLMWQFFRRFQLPPTS